MRYRFLLAAIAAAFMAIGTSAQNLRSEKILTDWEFRQGHDYWAVKGWTAVKVPHDWAIYGPFDRSHDLQSVAVTQNGEKVATVKTGRTGGLPYVGQGTYRHRLEVAPGTLDGRRHILFFDGAMSEAKVSVMGQQVCFWPYGYNSFWCDVTDYLKEGKNEVTVMLENRPESSRWYPGAGLFRKVRHITVPRIHIPVWGTYITTPHVAEDYASVTVRTRVEGMEDGSAVTVRTVIKDADGAVVAQRKDTRKLRNGEVEHQLNVNGPRLWSPESPELYYADTEIYAGASIDTDWSGARPVTTVKDGEILLDRVRTRFGIRSIEIRPEKGFYLNGKMRKFQGVCMHHDLGPIGAAVNKSALRRQLTILKDMGCDAIRTSHNMPAEELIELCDEMGFMVMLENFDEWDAAKCRNGYHRFFDKDSGDGMKWAEKDMINMLRHFRNNASVVMWSIGNEVPSQWAEGGLEVAAWLQDICHREDPTRPVTCGMDQFDAVLGNGFAAQLDVAGFNYKVDRYKQAYSLLPQGIILGSETASTVSSRGVYHFPVKLGAQITDADHQSSSYDTEYCWWSNIPDEDFAADEDYPWCIGQFVWTGFDYIGEPTPYDTDAWPNHTSVFGIVDLAYIPKDRFYLYRSLWNENEPTLHVLPHWNWKGREGQVTPVHVYTSYPSAELFVNGQSQGVRTKAAPSGKTPELGRRAMERYRLMWDEVIYRPGEIRVVAYDADGKKAMEKVVRTAGKASAIKLSAARNILDANGEDISFINVSLTDKDGNPVPVDNRLVNVKVSGAGSFRAMANGDPTCLEPFHKPQMHLFSGQLTVLVQSGNEPGNITVEVSSKGLKTAVVTLKTVTAAPNEPVRRAHRTMDAIYEKYGTSGTPLLRENYPFESGYKATYLAGEDKSPDKPYSYLWPFSGTLSAAVAIMERDPAYEKVLKSKVLPGLMKYYDTRRSPAAYASYINSDPLSDRFYDDNIWLGIDFADLYMLTGNKEYLAKAEEIWKFIESGIDNKLDGGIYWCEQKKQSKNACSTAPGAVFAAKLYLATENQDYLDMAKGLYQWTKQSLLDEEDWLYMDNMNMRREVDKRKFAYNSGQMVQAGALLYRITGRMEYIEEARRTAKACHEFFFKPFTGKDGKEFRILNPGDIWFHAVMVRGLVELYHMDGNAEYVNDVRKTLEHAWNEVRTPQGLFPADHTGARKDKRYWLLTQAAMAEMFARMSNI